MDLIIDNRIIKKDIKEILSLLQSEVNNGKLADISYTGDEVAVTCPFHKDGKEKKPSCFIYVGDDNKLPWGTFHCFTCGEKGSIIKFIASCFDRSEYFAKKWLKDNFTEKVIPELDVPIEDSINLSKPKKQQIKYLDESILSTFQSWHPYMRKRHISKSIAEQFEIKYDSNDKCIVFPVRDLKDKLLFLTRRSVEGKQFYIDNNASKCVYLLNECLKRNYKEVIVCEGQIDALVAWSYGFPAIALFGAGTTENQIDILNKTDIISYILMYDNDAAGRKGAERFKKLIKKNVFINDIIMLKGKDVADCSKEEFWNILRRNNISVD